MTGRPCDSPSCCANSSRRSVPSTLTSCAVTGVNSERVESSAARWKTRSTSNSARTRSRIHLSVIDPVNSRRTLRASAGSSGAMSTVTIDRPVCASWWIRPWPISPLAPVTSTDAVRIWRYYENSISRRRSSSRTATRSASTCSASSTVRRRSSCFGMPPRWTSSARSRVVSAHASQISTVRACAWRIFRNSSRSSRVITNWWSPPSGGLGPIQVRLPLDDGALDLVGAEIFGERPVQQSRQLRIRRKSKGDDLAGREPFEFAIAAEALQSSVHLEADDAVLETDRVRAADPDEREHAARQQQDAERADRRIPDDEQQEQHHRGDGEESRDRGQRGTMCVTCVALLCHRAPC